MPKSIAIFFDGTGSRSHGEKLSNVAKLSTRVSARNWTGEAQLVLYYRGVGAGTGSVWPARVMDLAFGGIFGTGLDQILTDAYRQLVQNYEVGDRIYLFGWSRGAFAARRFTTLLQHFGIIGKAYTPMIPDILKRQLTRNKMAAIEDLTGDFLDIRTDIAVAAPKSSTTQFRRQRKGRAALPDLEIAYLGLWDCVAAIGAPLGLNRVLRINRKLEEKFVGLPAFVQSARHAVALDEKSTLFPPLLISNFDQIPVERRTGDFTLTGAAGAGDMAEYLERNRRANPYQQLLFPGGHAAVGGCHSDGSIGDHTLAWVAMGATRKGLKFDGFKKWAQVDDVPQFEETQKRSPWFFGWRALSKRRALKTDWFNKYQENPTELAPITRDLMAREPRYRNLWE